MANDDSNKVMAGYLNQISFDIFGDNPPSVDPEDSDEGDPEDSDEGDPEELDEAISNKDLDAVLVNLIVPLSTYTGNAQKLLKFATINADGNVKLQKKFDKISAVIYKAERMVVDSTKGLKK